MAEEPQPAENPPQPTAGEQKQEAAALSNLNTNSIDEDPSASKASNADQAALGSALSYLSVSDKAKVNGAGPKTEVKKIKVNEEDLKFLVRDTVCNTEEMGFANRRPHRLRSWR